MRCLSKWSPRATQGGVSGTRVAAGASPAATAVLGSSCSQGEPCRVPLRRRAQRRLRRPTGSIALRDGFARLTPSGDEVFVEVVAASDAGRRLWDACCGRGKPGRHGGARLLLFVGGTLPGSPYAGALNVASDVQLAPSPFATDSRALPFDPLSFGGVDDHDAERSKLVPKLV